MIHLSRAFVHDIFDGNMEAIAEYHKFQLALCGGETGLPQNVLTDLNRRWMERSTNM